MASPMSERRLTSRSSCGDIIGHTTDVSSETWQGWVSKRRFNNGSSGDVVGHTTPVKSDDFEGWRSRRHSRLPDSGDIIAHSTDVRSDDFDGLTARRKSQTAHRSSGDIVLLRADTVSDAYLTFEERRRRSPKKYRSDDITVVMRPDTAPAESPSVERFGKRVGSFTDNTPTKEDIIRPYRPQRRILHVIGETTLDKQSTPERRGVKKIEAPSPGGHVLNPEERPTEAEIPTRDLLGDRKKRVDEFAPNEHLDERRPSKRLFPEPTHGDLISHTHASPSDASAVKFSKRVYEQSRFNESLHSADEVVSYQKRVFKTAPGTTDPISHSDEPAPAPIFAQTGYNQARVLKSSLKPSSRDPLRSSGDVISWSNVRL